VKESAKIYEKTSHKKTSNDALDAIAALTLVSVLVLSLIFWFSDMP
jgi:hypothetical protein